MMTYTYSLLIKMIEGAGLMSGQLHYKTDGVYGEVIHEGVVYSIDVKPIERECVCECRDCKA